MHHLEVQVYTGIKVSLSYRVSLNTSSLTSSRAVVDRAFVFAYSKNRPLDTKQTTFSRSRMKEYIVPFILQNQPKSPVYVP